MALSAESIRQVLEAFTSENVRVIHLEWIPGRSSVLAVKTSLGEPLGDLFPPDLDTVLSALNASDKKHLIGPGLSKIVVRWGGGQLILEQVV